MPESILVAYRRHAQALIQKAQTRADRSRLRREHAECVLRNRARLLAERLKQTTDPDKRRQILRQAFPSLDPEPAWMAPAGSRCQKIRPSKMLRRGRI